MIQKRLRMRIIRLNLIYLLPILLLCCAAVFSGFFALMRRSQVRFLTSESYMSQVYLMDRLGYREMLRGLEGMYFVKGAVDVPEGEVPGKSQEDFDQVFTAAAESFYEAKETEITSPIMRELERVIMLRVVDEYWMDHIDAMDDLKQGIRLQAYGNNNPVDVYKRESLDMFEEMIAAIQDETVRRLYAVRLRKDEEVKRERVAKGMVENVGGDGTKPKKQPTRVVKIGRNDPCPCGSGLKWKKCTCPEYHQN